MKLSPGEVYDMIECVGDEDDEEDGAPEGKERAKAADPVERFLGSGKKLEVPVLAQHYYENLLALALKSHLKAEKWKVVRVPGLYKDSKPDYSTTRGKR